VAINWFQEKRLSITQKHHLIATRWFRSQRKKFILMGMVSKQVEGLTFLKNINKDIDIFTMGEK
jgi:hypothetical protein